MKVACCENVLAVNDQRFRADDHPAFKLGNVTLCRLFDAVLLGHARVIAGNSALSKVGTATTACTIHSRHTGW